MENKRSRFPGNRFLIFAEDRQGAQTLQTVPFCDHVTETENIYGEIVTEKPEKAGYTEYIKLEKDVTGYVSYEYE